jgi:hypothetical protein
MAFKAYTTAERREVDIKRRESRLRTKQLKRRSLMEARHREELRKLARIETQEWEHFDYGR